jgi:uncharacterized protein
MKRDQVIEKLRQSEQALRARGVAHAALFGSLARGDTDDAQSDIDIMVEFDPAAEVTMYGYAGVKNYIAELFEASVDVVDRQAMKPRVRQHAAQDAVYAF